MSISLQLFQCFLYNYCRANGKLATEYRVHFTVAIRKAMCMDVYRQNNAPLRILHVIIRHVHGYKQTGQ